MAEKDLIPFKPKGDKRSDELRAKQKGSSSAKRKIAQRITASKVAKCKNCKLDCAFRESNTQLNPNALCIVPTLRAEAMRDKTSVVEWNDDKIKSFINELLNLYRQILIEDAKTENKSAKKLKRETIRDFNTMMNRLIQFKEKYYPPVQKSVNLNIDVTADRVIERIKYYKTISEKKKEKEKKKEDE